MPFLLRNASGIARLLAFRPALCPVKKTPSVTVHAMTEGVFLFYIILRNTSCAIWKYRIKLQASTMVVMKGVAMMAGSAPSFLAASGSMPPTSFARMTLKNSETLTTMA